LLRRNIACQWMMESLAAGPAVAAGGNERHTPSLPCMHFSYLKACLGVSRAFCSPVNLAGEIQPRWGSFMLGVRETNLWPFSSLVV
jgi:hypothetical protein